MEVIDSEWLKERLGDNRGKKAALAQALGVTNDKVSKMLSGVRGPKASEIPTILAFFGEASDEADPEFAELWKQLHPHERVFLKNAAKAQIAGRDQPPEQSPEEHE